MSVEEYLSTLKDQIRDKNAKDMVAAEYLCHIEDQATAFQNAGMERDQALLKAVEEMGDPVDVGNSLDRIHRPHMEWRFLFYILFISMMSVVIHYLINRGFSPKQGMESVFTYVSRTHVMSIALGLVLMLLVYRLDYTILAGKSRMIAATYLLLLTLISIPFGQTINGMNRWISIGGVSFSIQALLLLYLPLFAGILYDYRGNGATVIIKIILWMIAPIISRMFYGDVRTSFTLFMLISEMVLFLLALSRKWYNISTRKLIVSGGIAFFVIITSAIVVVCNLKDYQSHRIQYWLSHLGILSKTANDDNMYYISNRLSTVFSQSGMLAGSPDAIQSMNDLPGYTGDLILGSVAANCGLLTVIGILACLAMLTIGIFLISMRQKNSLGYIVGCACGIMITMQGMTNVLIVLGIIPLTDSVLPFFTNSGSFMIVDYILLGLILSIYRYKDIRVENRQIKYKTELKF
jgi:cell division protein FtsW (lipid II flippase)